MPKMPGRCGRVLFLLPLIWLAVSSTASAAALRIVGSPTVMLPVSEAAQILRAERGLEIEISSLGGSGAGISAVGEGTAQIGMTSRHVTAEDRADYADVTLTEIQIGVQAVALGVAQDVWEAGVRAVTREQVRAIYEGKIHSWRELGGPDEKLVFFNREEGHGTWEAFAQWLYGETKRAPLTRFPTVPTDSEARNTIEFTPGSMVQISPLAIDGKRSYALGIKLEDGSIVSPTREASLSGKYPMTRPLILVVNDKPTLQVKIMTDFLLGSRGQELVKKHGFFNRENRAAE